MPCSNGHFIFQILLYHLLQLRLESNTTSYLNRSIKWEKKNMNNMWNIIPPGVWRLIFIRKIMKTEWTQEQNSKSFNFCELMNKTSLLLIQKYKKSFHLPQFTLFSYCICFNYDNIHRRQLILFSIREFLLFTHSAKLFSSSSSYKFVEPSCEILLSLP